MILLLGFLTIMFQLRALYREDDRKGWKEMVVAYFKVLSKHSPGQTEKIQ
jgi:hypothetical protein